MTFSERFRWICEQRGTNPNDLSSAAGLDRSYVRKLVEREDANPNAKLRPGAEAMDAIARVANVSLTWLTTGRGPREPYGTPANETEPTPAPPISRTIVSLDRVDEQMNDVYDPERHQAADMILVRDAIKLGAALSKNMDPRRFVELLLDTAASHRQKNIKVKPSQLASLALGLVYEQLGHEREENERLRHHMALADQWLRDHGIEPPSSDAGPHPALLEARRDLLGIPVDAPSDKPAKTGKPKSKSIVKKR